MCVSITPTHITIEKYNQARINSDHRNTDNKKPEGKPFSYRAHIKEGMFAQSHFSSHPPNQHNYEGIVRLTKHFKGRHNK